MVKIMNVRQIIKKIVPRKYWSFLIQLVGKKQQYFDGKHTKHLIAEYSRKNQRESFAYDRQYKWMIDESKSGAGSCNAYYWQDLWAASKIIKRRPEVHYNIGSRIDGFIAHLQASGQQTVLIDIRKMDSNMPFVDFFQADATMLDNIEDDSIESISALCSLEHFGLGRYGDKIDPEACFKAMKSIQRVVKKGGYAYIAVPIGGEHVEFNAHRVFYASTIVKEFDEMKLIDFQVNTLDSNMCLQKCEDIHKYDHEYKNHGERFGLFEFQKI